MLISVRITESERPRCKTQWTLGHLAIEAHPLSCSISSHITLLSFTSPQNADKCEDYRERAAALQDAVDKLQTVFRERTGDEVDKEVKLADVMKPLDVPVLAEEIRFASIKTTTSTSSGSGGDPEKPGRLLMGNFIYHQSC